MHPVTFETRDITTDVALATKMAEVIAVDGACGRRLALRDGCTRAAQRVQWSCRRVRPAARIAAVLAHRRVHRDIHLLDVVDPGQHAELPDPSGVLAASAGLLRW